MRSKIAILSLVLLALWSSSLHAQGIKSYIRRANKLYHAKDYAGAIQSYRRALLRDSLSGKANFGLGASAYAQGRYDEAKSYLERAVQDQQLTPQQQAGVLHNLGNVAMKKKDYQSAVQSYEEALLRNPEDENTRYNLALAQKLLQQNKNNNNNQQQKQDPNKDKNKDNQQQKQDPKQDPSQDKNKPDQKPQQNKDKQGQPNEQRSGELSKEQAEQILRSFRTDDDKTRRRVEQQQRERQQQNSNKNKKRW
jgi:batC protein